MFIGFESDIIDLDNELSTHSYECCAVILQVSLHSTTVGQSITCKFQNRHLSLGCFRWKVIARVSRSESADPKMLQTVVPKVIWNLLQLMVSQFASSNGNIVQPCTLHVYVG